MRYKVAPIHQVLGVYALLSSIYPNILFFYFYKTSNELLIVECFYAYLSRIALRFLLAYTPNCPITSLASSSKSVFSNSFFSKPYFEAVHASNIDLIFACNSSEKA